MKQIIIIGGGIIGLCCAFRLLKPGVTVSIFDDEAALRSASWGNAGHIATEQTEPLASWPVLLSAAKRLFPAGALALSAGNLPEWLPFGLRMAIAAGRFDAGKRALKSLLCEALPAWEALSQDLGAPDLLVSDGHFVVWETPVSHQRGLEKWRRTDTGTATFRNATAFECASIQANLHRRIYGGIRFENTGQVADPTRLLETLRQAIAAKGGIIRGERVKALDVSNRHARVVLDDGSLVDADTIVLAAGVGSASLLEPLGTRVPMVSERGYHIQSSDYVWPTDMPPVVFEDRSIILTRFASALRACSIVEPGSINSPADPRKWEWLKEHLMDLGIEFGDEIETWVGSRPTLPDYLPAIGKSRHARNLHYSFGHQHLGLTLGARNAEIMARQVDDAPQLVDLHPFDIERFN